MTDVPLLPSLLDFADLALFLLRVWIALLFGWSGWGHLRKPRERGESLGMPPTATAALGAVELAAAILLVLGLWVQPAALLLAAVMVGATFKKAFAWKTGFWGENSQGWYYEVLYLLCNVVIATTGGGSIGI